LGLGDGSSAPARLRVAAAAVGAGAEALTCTYLHKQVGQRKRSRTIPARRAVAIDVVRSVAVRLLISRRVCKDTFHPRLVDVQENIIYYC
jgi:hypothetical protein